MGALLPAALQLQRRKSHKAVLAVDRRARLLLAARASVLELEFFQKAGDVYHLVSAFDKVSKQAVNLLCVFISRCISFTQSLAASNPRGQTADSMLPCTHPASVLRSKW